MREVLGLYSSCHEIQSVKYQGFHLESDHVDLLLDRGGTNLLIFGPGVRLGLEAKWTNGDVGGY